MDTRALLTAYDEQVRRSPLPRPGESVEREPHVTRVVRDQAGWGGVIWSDLEGRDVDLAIQAEIERFARCEEWEWKHYSYDLPLELPERLIRAGFQAGPPETVLAAELADLAVDFELPENVTLAQVSALEDAHALVRMQDEVFGSAIPGMVEVMMAGISQEPPTTVALAALADGEPVAGGRVELEPGSDFAGLWGGCTVPAWRGRGIFRALVAHATSIAAQRGYRYVQLDASSESRPILARLGLNELATTTPYRYQRAG